MGGWTLTPNIGGQLQAVSMGSFTETGAFALASTGSSSTFGKGWAGLKAERRFDAVTLTGYGRLAVYSDAADVPVTFAGGGTDMSVPGSRRGNVGSRLASPPPSSLPQRRLRLRRGTFSRGSSDAAAAVRGSSATAGFGSSAGVRPDHRRLSPMPQPSDPRYISIEEAARCDLGLPPERRRPLGQSESLPTSRIWASLTETCCRSSWPTRCTTPGPYFATYGRRMSASQYGAASASPRTRRSGTTANWLVRFRPVCRASWPMNSPRSSKCYLCLNQGGGGPCPRMGLANVSADGQIRQRLRLAGGLPGRLAVGQRPLTPRPLVRVQPRQPSNAHP